MLTVVRECDGERVLTVQIDEAAIDAEVVSALADVLDDIEARRNREPGGPLQWLPRTWSPATFRPGGLGPARSDIRFFARWEETLSRISRLKAKTFAAYDGRVGAAAVHVGLVMDLRLASVQARLTLGSFRGTLPRDGCVLATEARRSRQRSEDFLVGEDLPAKRASELGLVDVVEDTVDAVVETMLKTTRPVTPEAAYFTRRILDDCYLLEHSAAVELAKAARFKLGMPNREQ